MRSKFLKVLLPALAGVSLAAILFVTGVSPALDRGLRDLWTRRFTGGPDSAAPKIELVYIDQYSLSWVEKNLYVSWPWPREIYGLMANFLGQASAQAYDIVFSEVSSYGPEDDLRCAQGMDKAGNVVLAVVDPGKGASSAAGQTQVSRALGQLTAIPAKTVGYGQVRASPDPDGVLRRYAVWDSSKGQGGEGRDKTGLPALGYALWLKSRPASEADQYKEAATATAGPRLLRFRGKSPSFGARNAAEIIASAIDWQNGKTPKLSPSDFKGKFILVGLNAPGLLDRQAVPTDPAMPGVEIHATFLDNLLSNSFLTSVPPVLEAFSLILYAWALSWLAARFHRPLTLGAAALLGLAVPVAAGAVLFNGGIALHAVLFVAVGVGTAASAVVIAYSSEGRQRIFLRRAFAQYLSPSVIDRVVENPESLRLGGESRPITVFFSDVQGFTAFAENMEPAKLTEFMNFYLSIVSSAILEEGGTLDKYVGDAVVAFWNAPLYQTDHALKAIRAALAVQTRLKGAEADFLRLCGALPFTRIGIHTGAAIVGNMGSQARFNYTAMGDSVNTASRLEGANKEVDTAVLVSSDSLAAALGGGSPAAQGGTMSIEGVLFIKLGSLKLVGKSSPVEVWSPDLSVLGIGQKPEAWIGLRSLAAK